MEEMSKQERDFQIELVSRFDRMLKKDESYFFDVDEFEMIIDYYLENNILNKSNLAIKAAIEQHPGTTTFILRKAQYYVSSNRINKALDLLIKIERLEPENSDIFLSVIR